MHQGRSRRLAVALGAIAITIGVAACDGVQPTSTEPVAASVTAAGKGNANFNEKFAFLGVMFPDGTTGDIQAGSKRTNKGELTVCSYSTVGGVEYLGQFQSASFSSPDADAVKQFCLGNYANRVS